VEKAVGQKLPDIHGSQSSFDYDVTNIKITTLTYGSATIGMNNQLSFDLNNLHLHITLNWHYRENVWPHLPQGSGTADVDAAQVHIGVALVTGITADNKLTAKVGNIAADLRSVNIKTHGSLLSWLYNIIIDLFKNSLKNAAERALHDSLTTLINEQAAKLLADIPYIAKVDSIADLDYHLTSPIAYPAPVGDYIQVDFVGGVFPAGGALPKLPHHGITQYRSGKMLDFVLDQYVLDSALDTYQKAKVFDWLVTQATLPPNSPIKMNTSDFAIVFPLLAQKYPNRAMKVRLYTSVAPSLSLTNTAQKVAVPATAVVFVDQDGRQNFTEAFQLAVTQSGSFEAAIKSNRLFLKLDTLEFSLKVISSNIGAFDETIFNILVGTAINLVIVPGVNAALATGLPLPLIPAITLVDPALQFGAGVVEIGTNFQIHLTEEPMSEQMKQAIARGAGVASIQIDGPYEFGRNYFPLPETAQL